MKGLIFHVLADDSHELSSLTFPENQERHHFPLLQTRLNFVFLGLKQTMTEFERRVILVHCLRTHAAHAKRPAFCGLHLYVGHSAIL